MTHGCRPLFDGRVGVACERQGFIGAPDGESGTGAGMKPFLRVSPRSPA